MAIFRRSRRDGRNGEMVRRTSTVASVPSQADTQLSPMGVAWSTNALVACSLRMESQDSPRSHGLIVLCCPGNGPETPSLGEAKRRNKTGTRENRTRVKPSPQVFVRLLSHRPKPPETHVRTHVDPGRAPRRHPHLRETP